MGNWILNSGAAFSANSKTVTFTGADLQTIDGSSTTYFYNLAVNKTSGTL